MSERVLYFDLVGGAAGDMIMAALVDLGASLDEIRRAWSKMGLDRVTVEAVPAHPAGLRAVRLDVRIDGALADSEVVEGTSKIVGASHREGGRGHEHAGPGHSGHGHEHAGHGSGHGHSGHGHAHEHHASTHHHEGHAHRPYAVIRKLLEQSDLPGPVVALAQDAFHRLAEAEGLAHGIDPDDVVFHEVGADDAIADIVGVATALHSLAVDRVTVSPFPLGRGLTRGGHGPIPLPGPATLHLLQGAPTEGTPLVGETVTPTGAALLMAMATDFGPAPAMVIQATGTGSGHKEWPDRPNVVRALLGEGTSAPAAADEDVVLETNIDDMRPEDLKPLIDALFAAGAADAWAAPLYMKKGRPGLQVSALVRRSLESAVVEVFLIHSPTLGVRSSPVRRFRAERRMTTVETPFGAVRVKLSQRPDGSTLAAPELDDCVQRAAEAKVATRRVYEAALRIAWEV